MPEALRGEPNMTIIHPDLTGNLPRGDVFGNLVGRDSTVAVSPQSVEKKSSMDVE